MSARRRPAFVTTAPEDAAPPDALVVQYRPYVVKLARELAEAVAFHVDLDDLIGWGHMGLVEAARRFDVSRGVRFRTFAHRRIRGAMIDGMRKELGNTCSFGTGDDGGDDDGMPEPEIACADAAYRPDDQVLRAELRASLEVALETLTPLERAIVHHHYYNGQPVHLLTTSTRKSKSWLSRVHTRALRKMRASLLRSVDGVGAYL